MAVVLLVAAYLVYATFPNLVRWAVRKRLGGYRHRFNKVDTSRPLAPKETRTVAVIGGGLAGVSAAHALAERGFQTTVFEKEPQLGGKLGAWTTTFSDGRTEPVSHGFHAFFRHYYNLNRFLNRLQIRQDFVPIRDYMICRPNQDHMKFGRMDPTPILNLLSLRKAGFYRFRDILFSSARNHMNIFMRYDETKIFSELDGESFAEYADRTYLPDRLRLAFNVFARAFFADETKLSAAELMKSIHYYYFGHDHGLMYDYPPADYNHSIWNPVSQRLEDLDVTLRLGEPVQRLEFARDGWNVEGHHFDYVVLACDVAAAGPLLEQVGAPLDVSTLEPGQRYASVRLWVDRDARHTTPPFVITDRVEVLDAIAFYHRMEAEAARYVREAGGAVIELHCYAVPDDMPEADLLRKLKAELFDFFPELEGMRVRHESGYVQRNFTAFHVGRAAGRPATRSGLNRLFLAGDWVKLPFPAMLMEAAFSSGLMAANAIFEAEGVRQEPVDTVPPRGIFARAPVADGAWERRYA
ncbi:MAG: FAD-dependent oxidoreductase [Myxococcota bacterium]